jgi:hypothetical protein
MSEERYAPTRGWGTRSARGSTPEAKGDADEGPAYGGFGDDGEDLCVRD